MSTLIAIGTLILDKDLIASADEHDGKITIQLRDGRSWTWDKVAFVKCALAPWLARADDPATADYLRGYNSGYRAGLRRKTRDADA